MKLSDLLRETRQLQGHSLRDVEAKTGISNAYLSQLERGDASRPTPEKLRILADYYGIEYLDLMRSAGYIQSKETNAASEIPIRSAAKVSAIQAALKSVELTPDEENQVAEFIKFLRFQKKK